MNLTKFSRNYILCGHFDYHCLLCVETFHSADDLEKHIRWEKHRNNVKNHTYWPKFVKESISKIGNYYYCAFCNNILQDVKTIPFHIKTDKHMDHKKNPDILKKISIGQYSYDYIQLDKAKIKINIWNGVMGKKCLICNTAVEDAAKHMKLQEHVIKLILSEIIYDNDHYYRKINEDSFQCFTCKKVISSNLFTEHKKKHDKKTENGEQPLKETIKVSKSTRDEVDLDGKILLGWHKDLFHIDIENKKGICKLCQDVVHLTRRHFTSHLSMHRKSDDQQRQELGEMLYCKAVDHGKRRSEFAKYGQENYIKVNEGGRMGFCTLCDKQLSPHLSVFEEHVEGICHTNHLRLKRKENEKSQLKAIPLRKFIRSLEYCKKLEMFRINTDYLVFKCGFLFLKNINFNSSYNKFKCFACDEVFPEDEKDKHCKTDQHKANFLAAKFIANNDDIILQEIRPNLYHCSLCNEVLPYSKMLEKHLESFHHRSLKNRISTLRPTIDAQQYYYQTLKFQSISMDDNDNSLYSKIVKAIYK